MAVEIDITADQAGQRLDRLVKSLAPHIGFGAQQKWFRTGQVRLNGKRVKGAERVAAGDRLRLPPQAQKSDSADSHTASSAGPDPQLVEQLRAAAVFDDGRVLAFDKPTGLAVQGGTKTTRHVDGALPAFVNEAGEVPRLVHRLDRDTSGVLVVGRGRDAAAFLTRAFASREARKTYQALVTDWPEGEDAGVISAPLIKTRQGGEERVVVDLKAPNAQSAETLFRVERRAENGLVLITFEPRTGRTHQLRVHAAHFGGAIVGDGKYGVRLTRDWPAPKRLYLHAAALEMPHPDGSILRLSAPLPSAFEDALNA
ncbi:MAG: RluA family pseudouridine synthase [Alphaproteobacteria bacterium TMED89]|nr:RNA pseudouridine synthase [Rhodospirillaceae bacterium]RPH10224.1 MAG: RluA family pseudouridine synthase [Alphaproteobacteria bacterium TMED89]